MMKKVYHLIFLAVLLLFTSCQFDGHEAFDISSSWKIQNGDNMSWVNPDFDDSGWTDCPSMLKEIKFSDSSNRMWARKTVQIPNSMKKNEVWLGINKLSAAAEVYADGVYIGTVGSLSPNLDIRTERFVELLVPSVLVEDGKLSIALRINGNGGIFSFIGISLDNEAQASFQMHIHNVFSEKLFCIISYICLFIMFYSIFHFFGNKKDLTYLFYSLCQLFISRDHGIVSH